MLFSRDIGIDLGTSNTLVADKKGHIIINEPSVVAVDVKSKRVLATGNEAKDMIGRTPGSIVAVRPMRDGVIADFDMTADMLHDFMYRASKRNMFTKTRVVICVPSGVTEVERRAVEDAVRSAGAQDVELIDEPMAAALGAGLPVYEATGSMIVDIGGGTCDVAVVSLGGIASCNNVKVGGDAMDEAIVNYMRKKHNILIGERTAEDLKITIGCVYPKIQDADMEIRGRDLSSGLPKTVVVYSSEMLEALIEPAMMIVDAVHSVLEKTPPELAADISDRGIYMTGGGCLIDGLDKLLQEKTGINVMIAQDTVSCVALGTGKALENLDALDGKGKR